MSSIKHNENEKDANREENGEKEDDKTVALSLNFELNGIADEDALERNSEDNTDAVLLCRCG